MPLKRLQRLVGRSGAAALEIAGLEIRAIRTVRETHAGSALNKAGRLVLAGDADGGPVKIYETASIGHARFVAAAAEIGASCLRFPEVLARSGPFLVCRWVEGAPLSRRGATREGLQRLAQLQANLHAVDSAGLPDSDFDYWRDIIAPRFQRAAALVGNERIALQATELVDGWRAGAAETLNHPDLSLDNVILSNSSQLVPIDNELLYRGPGAFMDLLNTTNSLPADQQSLYLRAYLASPGARPLPDPEVFRAFWLARRAGTLFVAGDVRRLASVFASHAGTSKPDRLMTAIAELHAFRP